jgi:hypothetical protein
MKTHGRRIGVSHGGSIGVTNLFTTQHLVILVVVVIAEYQVTFVLGNFGILKRWPSLLHF